MTDVATIRPMTPADRQFVRSGWSASYRTSRVSCIRSSTATSTIRALVAAAFAKNNVVATLEIMGVINNTEKDTAALVAAVMQADQ